MQWSLELFKLLKTFLSHNFRLNHIFSFGSVASRNNRDTKHNNWNTHMTLRIQEMYNLPIVFLSDMVFFNHLLNKHFFIEIDV